MDVKRWWSGRRSTWSARMRRAMRLCAGGALAGLLCAGLLACWMAKPMQGGFKGKFIEQAPMGLQVAARGSVILGVWSWGAQEQARAHEVVGRSLVQVQPSFVQALGTEIKFLSWQVVSVALGGYSLFLWGLLGNAIRVRLIMLGMTSVSQKSPILLRVARFAIAHLIPALGIFFANVV